MARNGRGASASNSANDKPQDATTPMATSSISFAPGPDWYTIAQAATYLGLSADKTQTIRNAIKNRPEFKGDDNVRHVKIEGYDIAPLTYVRQAALDAYKAANASGERGRGGRLKGGPKRWVIRLTPEQEVAFRAGEINTSTIALEIASAPKKKKANTSAPAADASTPAASADQIGNGAMQQMTIGDAEAAAPSPDQPGDIVGTLDASVLPNESGDQV